ncbi:MAG: hypothetical protein CMK54_06570 [Proteobacteria bacterium]|nr:hypothetical protein [Pseudomonadota bacterium]
MISDLLSRYIIDLIETVKIGAILRYDLIKQVAFYCCWSKISQVTLKQQSYYLRKNFRDL